MKSICLKIKLQPTETCVSPAHAVDLEQNKWVAATVSPAGVLILDPHENDVIVDVDPGVDNNHAWEEFSLDHQDHLPAKRQKLLSEASGSGRENTQPEIPESESCHRSSRPTDRQQSASVSGFFEEPPLFPNGLRAHLATNLEGRLALRSDVNLDHTSRTHLVRSVVKYLFKYFSCKNK
ncbi:uncharacterized protein LOC117178685 [Belonocnema kinseyi]|uniref:uncharacterized protein LOC117178685 n=1 Tax=Belonocnema kinseyi TaxID=2817044 RepID=UPI00143CEFEF|nr:uncharacterized protein LOC117178685 [Belonocnema kinseyi]